MCIRDSLQTVNDLDIGTLFHDAAVRQFVDGSFVQLCGILDVYPQAGDVYKRQPLSYISAAGLILVEQVVKFNASEEFMSMFRVVIQLGAILAVVVLLSLIHI